MIPVICYICGCEFFIDIEEAMEFVEDIEAGEMVCGECFEEVINFWRIEKN